MSAARRTFGATWWGRAWIDALEHRASLDPNRLPRGRTYARHGHVRAIEIDDGQIRALVQGSRPTPYRVTVTVRPLDDDEWVRLLDAIASRAGHLAALLDGDLDPGILDDARAADVELLPGSGHLKPRCSCPDWADPCKHSAAVCYLVADEIDQDPFMVFALRGRRRDDIVADLRRRRIVPDSAQPDPAVADQRPAVDRGVAAADRWHRTVLGELPHAPRPRSAPGRPVPWATDPPADAPFTADGLQTLVADAARRAWLMTLGDGPTHLRLDRDTDLARRAAGRLDDDSLYWLARAAGIREHTLMRKAMAWQYGGPDGLAVIDEAPWRPPAGVMATARDSLARDLDLRRGYPRVDRNRITLDRHSQVRLDRRLRWWPFSKWGSYWELSGPAAERAEDVDLADRHW